MSPSLDVREREVKASSPARGRMLAGCPRYIGRIHRSSGVARRAAHIMPEFVLNQIEEMLSMV